MVQTQMMNIAVLRLPEGTQTLAAPEGICFPGGRGLGVQLLETLPAETEPLLFLTGPLTDAAIPGSGRYCAVLRGADGSPDCRTSGSSWGTALKQAGWDGLVIEGAAAAPVYLTVQGTSLRLHSAADLAGLTTGQTSAALHARHGENCTVLCIGPAGENQVPAASVHCGTRRAFGRGGIGAAMGRKGLKAIVICGAPTRDACSRCPVPCRHAAEAASEFTRLCDEYGLDAVSARQAAEVLQQLQPDIPASDWIPRISCPADALSRLAGSGAQALCRAYGLPGKIPKGRSSRLSPALGAMLDCLGLCHFAAAGMDAEQIARLSGTGCSGPQLLALGQALTELEQGQKVHPSAKK